MLSTPESRQDDGLILVFTDFTNDVEDGLQHSGQHLLSQHLLPQTGPHVLEPQLLRVRGREVAMKTVHALTAVLC